MLTISHTPAGSAMTQFLQHGGRFQCYVDGALTPTLILSDEEVTQIITVHLAQAKLILTLTERVASTLPAERRLLHQHKALKVLPTSPHGR